MSNPWDDFDDGRRTRERQISKTADGEKKEDLEDKPIGGCDWGQTGAEESDSEQGQNEESSKFISIYEQYVRDKKSIRQKTTNHKTYVINPQKEIRDWFENQSDVSDDVEFKPHIEQTDSDQYLCTIDLPLEEHDFNLTSELHDRRKDALDEVCLDACRMLDACGLLYAWQSTHSSLDEQIARKKRVNEALKEDDIIFDRTSEQATKKRHRASSDVDSPEGTLKGTTSSGVNTYESLMSRWRELNMSILMLKAKLVKLDLSVTQQRQTVSDKNANSSKQGMDKPAKIGCDNVSHTDDDDDEVDPLDKFMSTLETKTKLSIDDKIEKSRIRSQIASYEREQSECARLIEIAKPSKSVPRKKIA